MERDSGQKNRVEARRSRLLKNEISRRKRNGVGSQVLMGSDRKWEAEFAGRAWAGHTAGSGVGVEMRREEALERFQEKMLESGTGRGAAARMPGKPALWR